MTRKRHVASKATLRERIEAQIERNAHPNGKGAEVQQIFRAQAKALEQAESEDVRRVLVGHMPTVQSAHDRMKALKRKKQAA